jgi:predicted PurR-regulated permease PerM
VVSFVPYLGLIVGMVIASVAAIMQFHELMPLLYIALIFGGAQLLEGFVLTPLLLGDKIGLHPVVVIFAVLAGGELFGLFGMLLALPVAAVVMVLLRHSHQHYLSSEIYSSE